MSSDATCDPLEVWLSGYGYTGAAGNFLSTIDGLSENGSQIPFIVLEILLTIYVAAFSTVMSIDTLGTCASLAVSSAYAG